MNQQENAMVPIKNLGIWMDHSGACLMEFSAKPVETIEIVSKFTYEEKEYEGQQQPDYFKRISDIIKNYDEVILFGPTDEKFDLFNNLRADHRFKKVRIEIRQTDKLTEKQQYTFIREYFSKQGFILAIAV